MEMIGAIHQILKDWKKNVVSWIDSMEEVCHVCQQDEKFTLENIIFYIEVGGH